MSEFLSVHIVRVAVGTMKMDIVVKCFQFEFGVSIGDTTEKQKVAQWAAVLLAAVVVFGFPSARHMWVRRSGQGVGGVERRKSEGTDGTIATATATTRGSVGLGTLVFSFHSLILIFVFHVTPFHRNVFHQMCLYTCTKCSGVRRILWRGSSIFIFNERLKRT